MSINECEARMQPWAHSGFIKHYQLYNKDGGRDCKAYLCTKCVKDDIRRGYDWRLIPEETICKPSQEVNI